MRRSLQIWVLILIRIAFVLGAIYAFADGDTETGGLVSVGFVLSFLPQLIERRFKIDLPVWYELVIVLFVFASLFVGEFFDAYEQYWWWDKLLHISSGLILGYVGFIILHIVHVQDKLNISPGLIAFFTFCVGMASAGVWEMIEYGADNIFGTTMQHGLGDTMIDIILAAIGSLVATGVAYWHHRWPESSPARSGMRRLLQLNPAIKPAKKEAAK